MPKTLMTLICIFALAVTAYGADKKETTWTGAGGDNQWFTRPNWSNGTTHAGISANILMDGAVVNFEGGEARCRGIELGKGATLNVKSGSLAAAYSGIQIHGGTLNVTGGLLRAGVPGKYPRRIMLHEPGSKMTVGSPEAEGAPKLEILEQLTAGAKPDHSGEFHFSGYGTIEIGHDFTVGRYGEGNLTVEGGNLNISVGKDFICGYNNKWCTIAFAIDEAGASTIKVAGDIFLGHAKQAYNRSLFEVSFAEGFTPEAGTEYTILECGGKFSNYATFGKTGNGDTIVVGDVNLKAVYTEKSFKLVVE